MSQRVECVVGIDLGSTTTKAVIMDAEGDVLGRGITNSRSNYDVACTVARSEAVTDARLTLAHRALAREFPGRVDDVLELIERSRREIRHRMALERLREALAREADDPRHRAIRGPLRATLHEVVDEMEAETEELFAPGAERQSDFFRDLASSSYMRHAERRSEPESLTYDLLIGIFDKAILEVENEVLDVTFDDRVLGAIDRLLIGSPATGGRAAAPPQRRRERSGLDLAEAERQELSRMLRRALQSELDEAGAVGTGYGRARLPFPKESIRSEILCHGLGAHSMFPATATVLDIGGQDTKAIQVDDSGIVTGFQMNDRCAAGCGRYLGYVADEMNMGVHELGPMAMQATRRVKINSTCTVFAGAELRDRLNLGQRREDVLAGLHRAVMLRAMSLLARSGGVFDEFTFTGGVANNVAAVTALRELVEENYGRRTLNISADSIYTGAVGAALFAHRTWLGTSDLRFPEPQLDVPTAPGDVGEGMAG